MHSRAQRALTVLPAALLVAVAGWQAIRVQTHDQSPWIGAGFSMFSYVDASAYRPLVTVAAEDASIEIAIPDHLRKEAERLLSAPTDDRAARFARALASEAGRAVRVEIWRPVFDGETLVVDAVIIASGTGEAG
jgi:hypothetical protein